MTLFRSALFNLVFFVISFVMTVAATPARLLAPDRVMGFAVLWARLLIAALRLICGVRLDVQGLENIPPGAALIASAHQSAFDTFVWLSLLPRCCYVFKLELLRIPLFGGLIQATRMIPVDRAAGASAIRGLLRGGTRAAREERQIVIFPEGTRADPGCPRDLQPGVAALAARIGLPVIPVATDSGYCWSRRAFTKRPGTIHIVIGKPIPAGTARDVLMQTLAERMNTLSDGSQATAGNGQ